MKEKLKLVYCRKSRSKSCHSCTWHSSQTYNNYQYISKHVGDMMCTSRMPENSLWENNFEKVSEICQSCTQHAYSSRPTSLPNVIKKSWRAKELRSAQKCVYEGHQADWCISWTFRFDTLGHCWKQKVKNTFYIKICNISSQMTYDTLDFFQWLIIYS